MTVMLEKSDRVPNGYRLTTELLVCEPRAFVFEFFADAFQLETITPPWLTAHKLAHNAFSYLVSGPRWRLFWTPLAAERPEYNREGSVDAELRGVDCGAAHDVSKSEKLLPGRSCQAVPPRYGVGMKETQWPLVSLAGLNN